MKATRSLAIVLCIVMGFAAVDTYAAPPAAFTYQGQLKYRGLPVSGEARFTFTLWDSELEGRRLAESVEARLTVVNGLFTAPLDFGPDVFNGEPRWLEIMVATEQGEGRLTPRQPITPAPFALYALDAPDSGGVDSPWTTSGAGLYYNSGNVGVGTDTPQYPLHASTSTNSGRAVYGQAAAAAGGGVGVFGQADHGTGRAITGWASNAAGVNFAILGQTESDDGYAGYFSGGRSYFEGNVGFGELEPEYPVHAVLSATSGSAVYGHAPDTATSGRGVFGLADGTGGRGLTGYATDSTGTNFGLIAATDSPDGYAGYFMGGRSYFQNNVGIGVANPAVKLDVNGTVQANSFDYRTPKTKTLIIHNLSFRPGSSGYTWGYLDGLWVGASQTTGTFSAPVVLPDGATITQLKAHVLDASVGSNINVSLLYRDLVSQSAAVMAAASSSGNPGLQVIQDDVITEAVIDNAGRYYHVVIASNDWPGTPLRLRMVTVTYTVDSLD